MLRVETTNPMMKTRLRRVLSLALLGALSAWALDYAIFEQDFEEINIFGLVFYLNRPTWSEIFGVHVRPGTILLIILMIAGALLGGIVGWLIQPSKQTRVEDND